MIPLDEYRAAKMTTAERKVHGEDGIAPEIAKRRDLESENFQFCNTALLDEMYLINGQF